MPNNVAGTHDKIQNWQISENRRSSVREYSFFFSQIAVIRQTRQGSPLRLHIRSAEKAILYVSQRFNLTATGWTDGRTPSWSCPSRLDLIESRTVLLEGRTLLHLMRTSSCSHIKQRRLLASLTRYWIATWALTSESLRISGSTPGITTEKETTTNAEFSSRKDCHGRAEFTFDCVRSNVSALFAADQHVAVYFTDSRSAKTKESEWSKGAKGMGRPDGRSP